MRILIALIIIITTPYFCQAQTMEASWYSVNSLKKEGTWKRTKGVMANGNLFDETAYTVASRVHPLGSHVVVFCPQTEKSIIAEVTDRISKKYGHRIDLSKGAFSQIADLEQGIVEVKVMEVQ